MRILGFDTATAATTVAFCDLGSGIVIEARDDPPISERPRHMTRLMQLITDVVERGCGGWEGVDRVAVGLGPGSFTGLRIGIATARALAQAREIELVGISTLRSLALNASAPNRDLLADPSAAVLAVLDARRGEVFAACWAADQLLLEPAALTPPALAALIPQLASRPLTIGPGALRFRGELESSGAIIPGPDSGLHLVAAVNHCKLALEAAADTDVRPGYLRRPDAELTRRPRGRR